VPEDHRGQRRPPLRLQAALNSLLLELAQQVVCKDGEGARKFVEIASQAQPPRRSAKRVALSIANSPLVKTAVAGEDANWGRVVMAVGKAGEPADRDKLDISFGDIMVAEQGARARPMTSRPSPTT
jgi:glutamate N-acetyltransferase/amino-acid N-acetyltransferase